MTQPQAPTRAPLPSVRLLGVRFDAMTETQAIAHVLDELDAGRGGLVVTPNLDHLRRCHRHSDYRAIVGGAQLVVADGVPLLWASRIAGTPLPQVVPGSNLVSSLSAGAAARGRSIFLLGGAAGSADGAARVLVARSPRLRVAGRYCPPHGFEDDPDEMCRIETALLSASPDIAFIGLGSPKQERLALRLRSLLPQTWWLGVGISFSYLAGDVRRAPVWMRRAGLEWAHRLGSEPRRLARRYLVEGISFGLQLAAWSAAQRCLGARRRTPRPDPCDHEDR